MIGVVDLDLQTTTSVKLAPPNLEIMKIATYYKLEENTFCRLISLDEEEFEGYDKIYFFSETSTNPKIPPAFLRANNVIFGGTTFTNGVYIPFENSIIDFTLPRPAIYKEYLKQKYQDGIKTSIIGHILDDTYYRCYAGNELLPLPPIKRNKRLFLYDKNFFYDDWEDIMKRIISHKPSSIICIHPIVCTKLSQYFSIRNYEKIARKNKIILDLNIPLNEVNYMLRQYKNQFLADITPTSDVCITLGNTFKTSFQYYKDFIYKLNLLFAFWSNNIPLKIYYIPPAIGVTDILQPLSQLVETFSKNITLEKTLRQRFTFKTVKNNPAMLAYKQLLKFHPEAKDLFDQTYQGLVKRGIWRL